MNTNNTNPGGAFTLPGTSITLNRLGYGAMQLAGEGVWGPPRDPDAAEAKQAIEGCVHLRLSPGLICDRVAVKRAAPAGLTVLEYKPFDPKAAHELQQLYGLIFGHRRS